MSAPDDEIVFFAERRGWRLNIDLHRRLLVLAQDAPELPAEFGVVELTIDDAQAVANTLERAIDEFRSDFQPTSEAAAPMLNNTNGGTQPRTDT